MKLARALFVFLLLVTHRPGYGAEMQTIEDLLESRWFEIEMIVFERLDVLDVNTNETLTQTKARSWPANLMMIGKLTPSIEDEDASALMLDSPYCLGYPDLAEEDNLHPILQALLEPQVATAEELDNLESSPTTAVSAQEPNVDTIEPDQAPVPTDELAGALPPLNTPQLTLTPYLQFLADVAAYEDSLRASSYQWLPNLALNEEVKALNRQRNLRPIIQRRWRQAVPARDNPQPIYIASDTSPSAPITTAGYAKIEGYLSVTVGRYLHFAPMLWYHADTLGVTPVPFPVTKPLLPLDDNRYMVLSESRRMRSTDLHYLDHPKFGVIVRIDTVEIPAELLAKQEALTAIE